MVRPARLCAAVIAVVAFVASPSGAQVDHFEISTIPSPQTAGVPFTATITAVDAGGVPDSTFNDRVDLASLSGGDVAPPFVNGSAFVNGSWTGNVTFYRVSSVTALLVSDQAIPQHSGVSNTFAVVGSNVLSRLLILCPGETHVPGTTNGKVGTPAGTTAGAWYSPVRAFGCDQYYNVVDSASDTVAVLSSTDPAAIVPAPVAFTSGSPATITFTNAVALLTAGTNDLYVIDLTDPTVDPDTSYPINTSAASLHHFDLDTIPSPQYTTTPFPLTVVARDVYGNSVALTGSASLSTNAPPGTMTPTSAPFGGDSLAQVNVSYRYANDTAWIAVAYGGVADTTNVFDVDAGPSAMVMVLASGQTLTPGVSPGYAGTVQTAVAGEWYPLTVAIVDQWWNPTSDVQNTQFGTLGNSDPYADLPPVQDLTGIVSADVRFHLADTSHVVTATPTGTGVSGQSLPIPVIAGPIERLIVLSPTETLLPGTIEGKTSDSTAAVYSGTPFPIHVYATDRYANVVDVVDMVFLSSTDTLALFTPGPLAPLSGGHVEVSTVMRTEGIQQIVAHDSSDSQNVIPGETWLRVRAGNYHFEVFVPDSAVAGVDDPDTFPVLIRIVNNDTGNLEPITRTVEVTARLATNPTQPGNGVLRVQGGAYAVVTDGEVTVQAAYTRAEPIVIFVRDVETSASGMSNVIMIYPNVFSLITPFASLVGVLPGDTANVRFICTDPFGNPIPNLSVGFTIQPDSGTVYAVLSDTSVATTLQGIAAVDLRIESRGDSVRIVASSEPLSARSTAYTPGPPITRLVATTAGGLSETWSPDSSTVYCSPTSRFRLEAVPGDPDLVTVDSTFCQIEADPYFLTYLRPDTLVAQFFLDTIGVYSLQYYSVDSIGSAESPETTRVIVALPDSLHGFVSYPNPFDPAVGPAALQYTLSFASDATVEIYSLFGELVYRATYRAGSQGGRQGSNLVFWDGDNGRGHPVGSGGYIAVVTGGRDKFVRKIAVVR